MRDPGDVSLPPDDFGAMAAPCKHDQDFPAMREARQRGLRPAPMRIDLHRFAAWCAHVLELPGLDSSRAFVIPRRRGIA